MTEDIIKHSQLPKSWTGQILYRKAFDAQKQAPAGSELSRDFFVALRSVLKDKE